MADGGVSSDALVPHSVMISQIDAAVAAERERCAKIAEGFSLEYQRALDSVSDDETWGWAMDEMSEQVNVRFFSVINKVRTLAAKIRSGQ